VGKAVVAAASMWSAVLLAVGGAAHAAGWVPDPVVVGIGSSPDLITNRTFAASDGTVTQILEAGSSSADLKTAVSTRPPGGTFGAIDVWDGGYSSLVGGPGGSVAVVTYEEIDPALPALAKAYVRIKRPDGKFSAKIQVSSGLPSVTPGFVDPDGTFWAITNNPAEATVKLVRVAADGTAKTTPLISLDPGDKVVVTSLLRLPGGGARMAFSLRNDHQDDLHGKCVRDTGLLATSATPDGTVSPLTVEDQGRATDDKGVLNCNQVGHGYSDPGSHQVFPHVMAVSPGGETSLIASAVTIGQDGKAHPGVARLYGPADKGFDAFAGELVYDALAQPISAAYAKEDPVVLMTNSAGASSLLMTQRIGGAWSAPTLLSSAPDQFPAMVGSPDGRALIALFDIPPTGQSMKPGTIRAYVRNPGGQLDAIKPLEDKVIFRGVWADGAGDLGVTMEGDSDPGPAYIPVTLLGVYDGAAPKLTVAGPQGGAAGQPTGPFTATATDVWSGVPNPPTWTFSGGGDAAGASVDHAFAAAGAQSATAKVVDAAGNETSATANLTVDAASAATQQQNQQQTPHVPQKDTTKPRLTKVKLAFDRRKRVATLKFTLSEDATVNLTIRLKGKRRATMITKKLKKGSRSITTARLKSLGRYTFSLLATDAAKNRSKVATLSKRL
jgi:hypothetical protein